MKKTIKQHKEDVYAYLKQRWEQEHYVPTQREIAIDCGISPVTLNKCLDILEAQGRITRQALQSRNIRMVEASDKQEKNEIAEAVYAYLLEVLSTGTAPTQQEIADACYISRSAVRRALLWLEAQERIVRGQGQRNIRLPESLPE